MHKVILFKEESSIFRRTSLNTFYFFCSDHAHDHQKPSSTFISLSFFSSLLFPPPSCPAGRAQGATGQSSCGECDSGIFPSSLMFLTLMKFNWAVHRQVCVDARCIQLWFLCVREIYIQQGDEQLHTVFNGKDQRWRGEDLFELLIWFL